MSNETECPVAILASGQMLKLRKIMLYDEDDVLIVAALRAHAAKGLNAGGGTGIGILGTPSLGFAAEAAGLMLVSGLLSGLVQKTAIEFLQLAEERNQWLSTRGIFFAASQINNGHVPKPGSWFALRPPLERKLPIQQLTKIEQDALLQKHKSSARNLVQGALQLSGPPRYVHNGDEFVSVETDVGYMSIRWSQVVAYRPLQS
jgi:hypothetical protein